MRSQQTQTIRNRRGFALGRGSRKNVIRRLLELHGLSDEHGRRIEPPETTAGEAVDQPRALAAAAGGGD